MIHDLFSAAGRLYGFIKNCSTSVNPNKIRTWLEIIDKDQSMIKINKSRFSGFQTRTAAALRRYEEDINVFVADKMGERAIFKALKKRYPFAKNIPSASTIRRFLERKNG